MPNIWNWSQEERLLSIETFLMEMEDDKLHTVKMELLL